MNNLPQPMASSSRLLVAPNYQVYSEELQSELHESLKKRYGVPMRDRLKMDQSWQQQDAPAIGVKRGQEPLDHEGSKKQKLMFDFDDENIQEEIDTTRKQAEE